MRGRTFLIVLGILVLLAIAVILGLMVFGGGIQVIDDLLGREEPVVDVVVDDADGDTEDTGPAPTPTPSVRFEEVVVAAIPMPIGTVIEEQFLMTEPRPDTNIAVQAGYVFNDVDEVVGRITRTNIDQGQAVLDSMIALSPIDLATIGSDLALYVDQGDVAIAFPIDRYSGAAYAMRPGDLVDVLASMEFVDIDPEFASALPNQLQIVDEQVLAQGGSFLLSPVNEGRLELIPEVNQVAIIGPGQEAAGGAELLQVPRRVAQLTIQQAEVIWVGTWQDPRELAEQAQAAAQVPPGGQEGAEEAQPAVEPTPASVFERREFQPDVVILSMPLQDAVYLKFAMDRGMNLDLALRSRGDNSVFITTPVDLPQLVEQGGLDLPEERLEIDVVPRADEVESPFLEPRTPGQP